MLYLGKYVSVFTLCNFGSMFYFKHRLFVFLDVELVVTVIV